MKNKFINLKKILPVVFLLLVSYFYGQVRIANSILNTVAFNSSAFIDASSNPEYNLPANPNIGKGLLYPRTDLRTFTAFSGLPVGIPNSYPSYYDGLMVFNTATSGVAGVGNTEGTLCRGYWYYDNPQVSGTTISTTGTWRPLRPDLCSSTNPPVVTTLNCSGVTLTGTLTQGVAAAGVSVTVPYTGGNGVVYPEGASIPSTGVTELFATLQADTLANGDGTLTYTITGTPTSSGTAHFAISFGGKSCDLQVTVAPAASPVTLNCLGIISDNVNFTQGVFMSGNQYFTMIPFTGGPISYPTQEINSTGVFGLKATLQANTSSNQFVFLISGTANSVGEANFAFTYEGQTCTFKRNVIGGAPSNPDTVVMCGSSKAWRTRNEGATPGSDPNTPSSQIQGAKFIWGQPTPVMTQSDDIANPNAIPMNPNLNFTWTSPTKSSTDPCPSGFRVPTRTEWDTLISNNSYTILGGGIGSPTNFGSAIQFHCTNGNTLTLPYAGGRNRTTGILHDRGEQGYYWYGDSSPTGMIALFGMAGPQAYTGSDIGSGYSVRCISE
ncbi:hypothetical protein D1631_06410 [Chryseobacterium nematophagum]|uniref:Uncharacterized protein n=1 Tax=Chryseobacterium nematophagum TaxID=2305228 RepID=A0A3M7TDK2_9FLAO|nr:FISUMP domain-containing protein [Chryseobacterium nematophagum]RNA61585.1 hypothetical protein D1631_06410 [Chryseobacterium nematophagum]